MTRPQIGRFTWIGTSLGAAFLIAAFSLLTLMLTIQQALFAEYLKLKATAAPEAMTALTQAYNLVNQVQLGADVAFDILYCIGLFTVSSALLTTPGLPRVLGLYGIVSSVCLLGLNLWTFPIDPKSAGAFDLGPATILWWVGLLVLDRRQLKQTEAA